MFLARHFATTTPYRRLEVLQSDGHSTPKLKGEKTLQCCRSNSGESMRDLLIEVIYLHGLALVRGERWRHL